MKCKSLLSCLGLLFVLLLSQNAEAVFINFEDLADLDPVTNQYSGLGVTFANATALTAGISLNEFDFPPYSGANVVFDDGGAMTLSFSTPMENFGAYFTYAAPLTLSFYDALNNLEGTVSSPFSSNLALSGDPGSSPNELLSFAWAAGISSVVIAGDPAGGSFTMDDMSATPVPEPSTVLLFATGMAGVVGWGWRKKGLCERRPPSSRG